MHFRFVQKGNVNASLALTKNQLSVFIKCSTYVFFRLTIQFWLFFHLFICMFIFIKIGLIQLHKYGKEVLQNTHRTLRGRGNTLISGVQQMNPPQGWRNLVVGYGSCHTNIWDIYYYLPQAAKPIFERFTRACNTNVLGLPPPLLPDLKHMLKSLLMRPKYWKKNWK